MTFWGNAVTVYMLAASYIQHGSFGFLVVLWPVFVCRYSCSMYNRYLVLVGGGI